MAGHDLHFVGQLPIYWNERDLAVPPGALEALEDVQDRLAFEGLAAYATNQFLRRDVFVKGPAAPADGVRDAYLDATPFGSLAPGGVAKVAHLAFHALHYVGEVFDALLPALALGAATGADLASRPELSRFDAARVRAAIVRLLFGGQVAPLLQRTRTANESVGRAARPYVIASAFNRAVLQAPAEAAAPLVLASPVAGTGIAPTKAQAEALRTSAAPGAKSDARELAKLVELGILTPGRAADQVV
jgi:hypothetical protein